MTDRADKPHHSWVEGILLLEPTCNGLVCYGQPYQECWSWESYCEYIRIVGGVGKHDVHKRYVYSSDRTLGDQTELRNPQQLQYTNQK